MQINRTSSNYYGITAPDIPAPILGNADETRPDLTQANQTLETARAKITDTKKTEDKKAPNQAPKQQPLTPAAIYNAQDSTFYPQEISAGGKYLLCSKVESKKTIYRIFDTSARKYLSLKHLNDLSKNDNRVLGFYKNEDALLAFSPAKTEPFTETDKITGKKIVRDKVIEKACLYTLDIKTGNKKILLRFDNYPYILEYSNSQNAVYVQENISGNSSQYNVGYYPNESVLLSVTKISLNEEQAGKREVVYNTYRQDIYYWYSGSSPDEKYIALSKNPIDGKKTPGEIFVYDKETRKEYPVTSNEKHEIILGWSADSRYLLYAVKVKDRCVNSQLELWAYDTGAKKSKRLTDGQKISMEGFQISKNPNQNYVYFSSPDGFYNNTYKINLNQINSNSDELPPAELMLSSKDGYAAGIGVVSNNADKMYFIADTNESPRALTCLDIASGKKEAVLDPNKGFYKKYNVPKSEIKKFKTTTEDGKEIEMEYKITYPPGFENGKNFPLILLIHGGPNGRFSAGFANHEQPELLASRGYVVISPNIRGSEGYGEEFLEGIYADNKGNNLSTKGYNDLMAALGNVLSVHGDKIDEKRMGVYGFSYGGCMVNWIIAKGDKRFACAMSGAGVAAYLPSEQDRGFVEVHFPGDITSKEAVGNKIYPASPLAALADSLNKDPNFNIIPLCIIHGTADKTVPFSESKRFYEELAKHNINPRFIPYNGVDHGILSWEDGFITHYNYVINWFNRYLQPDKEVYDSQTYCIFSNDNEKRLSGVKAKSMAKTADGKAAKNGKFAAVSFEIDSRKAFGIDILKANFVLEDEKGNKYQPVGVISAEDAKKENWALKEIKEQKDYSIAAKKYTFVFDIPKDTNEVIFKTKDFPPVKITVTKAMEKQKEKPDWRK